jgi:hypothetical protein
VELELDVEVEVELELELELLVLEEALVSDDDEVEVEGLVVVSVSEVAELEEEEVRDKLVDVALLLERIAELDERELVVVLLATRGETTVNAMKAEPSSRIATIAMRMPLETIVGRLRENMILAILRF